MGDTKRNNNRRYPNCKGRRPDHASKRREEALIRLESWQNLSVQDQLLIIDQRLGKGIGATKQRARLIARLNKPS